MKNTLILIVSILLIMPSANAQVNSIQLSPISYSEIPFSVDVNHRINSTTALYYQRSIYKKIHVEGGVYYLNRILKYK